MPRILVDTGPLVAMFNQRDRFHEWARSQMARLKPPLFTCESVLAESWHLLAQAYEGRIRLLELVHKGLLDARFSLTAEIDGVLPLLRKYEDVPMSIADACLVRMAELHAASSVLTIDSDFQIYRRHGRQKIPTIAPPLS